MYFASFYLTHLNRNKKKESEPVRRNIRKDVETASRHRARSVSTSRRQVGRQSPDILFQSTPLYLPQNQNVKTIEISINKREQTQQINRKPGQNQNTKQVSKKKLSTEGIMSSGPSTRVEEAGEAVEEVRMRRRDKGTGQYQYPRSDTCCKVIADGFLIYNLIKTSVIVFQIFCF